ncbi:condensation domain-containing protein, partial [Streptomyces sp. H27-D2]|uniref:condensation domain-containing protein n=1 Tax=Streptomyces sp. H27-D2 TaxID=3046304 RepID=UPI002DBF6497
TGLQAQQSALLDHQHLSLSSIQRVAGPGATFDTLMAFENYPGDPAVPPSAEGLSLAGTELRESTSFALALGVNPTEDLGLRLDYRPDLFDRHEAVQMGRRLVRVLEQVLADPQMRVGDIDVLEETERARVVEQWNDTTQPVPVGSVVDLIAAWAGAAPGVAAVRCGPVVLS